MAVLRLGAAVWERLPHVFMKRRHTAFAVAQSGGRAPAFVQVDAAPPADWNMAFPTFHSAVCLEARNALTCAPMDTLLADADLDHGVYALREGTVLAFDRATLRAAEWCATTGRKTPLDWSLPSASAGALTVHWDAVFGELYVAFRLAHSLPWAVYRRKGLGAVAALHAHAPILRIFRANLPLAPFAIWSCAPRESDDVVLAHGWTALPQTHGDPIADPAACCVTNV